MKKIIHLSDLHIGYPGCYKNAKKLFASIIQEIKDPGNHIIIITGDLVNNAFNIRAVRRAQKFIAGLERAGFVVLVVPGNHDYGTSGIGFHFFVKCFKKNYYKNKNISYPKVDVVSSVAFFGLDSTAEELSLADFLFAEGELGKEQLARLDKMLASPIYKDLRKVVYLHHH
ncbi:MAG: metallophosphoesterase, partial [Bacteroidales bacterium]|nr:metallophosphoesterase [Bacteroidales bacterium]